MKFKKGQKAWNKGTKGVMKLNKTSFKNGDKGFWLGKKRSKKDIKKMVDNRRGYKASEKTKKKQSEALRGDKCYRWKGGISPENVKIRTSLEYRYWRKKIFLRDNFTCQKYKIRGRDLVAHHINNFSDFPELRFAIDNGITLSKRAHKEFHSIYGIKNNTREQLQEFLVCYGTGDTGPTGSTTTEGSLYIKYTA